MRTVKKTNTIIKFVIFFITYWSYYSFQMPVFLFSIFEQSGEAKSYVLMRTQEQYV